MRIYLVQHGKSLSPEKDPHKGLSEAGRAETRRIAEVAQGYDVPVDAIWHSGKTRARQTAEIFARHLRPAGGVRRVAGLQPLDDVEPFAANLAAADKLMLVGHLPFMSRMAAYLVTGRNTPPVFRFQNSGIVCLGHDAGQNQWVIRWSLMPNIG